MTQVVLRNAAECVSCGHLLKSLHRHDYRTHSCNPSTWFMVDGGRSYIRRGWGAGAPFRHYIERSITVELEIYDNCLRGY